MDRFAKKVTWKKASLFTALFAVFYVLINYTGIGVAGLLQITKGANILDFAFGYSAAEACDMLTALGLEGRAFYLTRILPLDFPFPFTYMLCYAGWIALMGKYAAPKAAVKFLLAVPVLAMLFDWTENIGILSMLINYPALPALAAMTASIAGMLKRVFILCSFAVIAILLLRIITLKVSRRHKPLW